MRTKRRRIRRKSMIDQSSRWWYVVAGVADAGKRTRRRMRKIVSWSFALL
jgi:hypothetical protein